MSSWSARRFTRRQLLVGGGATAAAVLLGACGGDDGDIESFSLVQFFGGPMFVPDRETRLPFGLADVDGLLPLDRTPERVDVRLFGPDGASLGAPVEVERRSAGLQKPYFPLLATFPEPGIYTARTEIDGAGAEMAITVDAPDDVVVIQPGAAMPQVDTPTTADPHGVDPICTREPVCPLHDVTLASALGEGVPVALLVASPAFCQIAICGPVLEVVLEVRDDFPEVHFLHAEVYAKPEADLDTYAPVIEKLGLHFEPCLVLVGADGTVVDRIDTIFDRSEVRARLAALV